MESFIGHQDLVGGSSVIVHGQVLGGSSFKEIKAKRPEQKKLKRGLN